MIDFVFYFRNAFKTWRIQKFSKSIFFRWGGFAPSISRRSYDGPYPYWLASEWDSQKSLPDFSYIPSSLLNTNSTTSGKLRIAQKKTSRTQKTVSEYFPSYSFWSKMDKKFPIFEQYLKKSEDWFFIRFITLRIFHANNTISGGRGRGLRLVNKE